VRRCARTRLYRRCPAVWSCQADRDAAPKSRPARSPGSIRRRMMPVGPRGSWRSGFLFAAPPGVITATAPSSLRHSPPGSRTPCGTARPTGAMRSLKPCLRSARRRCGRLPNDRAARHGTGAPGIRDNVRAECAAASGSGEGLCGGETPRTEQCHGSVRDGPISATISLTPEKSDAKRLP